jgi:hypothetical protein
LGALLTGARQKPDQALFEVTGNPIGLSKESLKLSGWVFLEQTLIFPS